MYDHAVHLQRAPFSWEPIAGTPRDTDEVLAQVRSLAERGWHVVDLAGPEPAMQPKLLADVLREVTSLGMSARLHTAGAVDLRALSEAGVSQVVVRVWGPQRIHETLAGNWAHAEATLAKAQALNLRAHLDVGLTNALSGDWITELPATAELVLTDLRARRAPSEIIRTHGLRRPERLALADRALREVSYPLHFIGLADWSAPPWRSTGATYPHGKNTLLALRAGVPLPEAASGTASEELTDEERRELTAHGSPAHPAAAPSAPSPRAERPALVNGAGTDRIFHEWTLPSLGELLKARTDAHVHHLRATDGPGIEAWPRPIEASGPWIDSLDFSDRDLVIVSGLTDGVRVANHPTLPDNARVVVCDFHHLHGVESWWARYLKPGELSIDNPWFPRDTVRFHSLFPRFAGTYHRSGIPFDRIHWMPYPLSLAEFGPREPTRMVLAAGNHLRDYPTLEAALAQTQGVQEQLVVHAGIETPSSLNNRGSVGIRALAKLVQACRFLLVPLLPDRQKPAGLTMVSMAHAAGRPVIISAARGAMPFVRHGVDGIVVPPRSPKALARAIQRLHDDDALVERLSAGAREAGAKLSLESWASTLLGD